MALTPRLASAMQPKVTPSEVVRDAPAVSRPMANPIPGLAKANPLSVATVTPRSPVTAPGVLPRSPLAMDPRAAQAAQRMIAKPTVLGTMTKPMAHRGLGVFMRG